MPGGELPLVLSRFVPNDLDRDVITDVSSSGKPNQPYIVDLVTLERMFFQTIPLELKYNPESNWVAIATAGRNTPFYQYLGAEDTLTFTLTFYSNHDTYADVIRKCKWLESLSKSDGFKSKPHLVKLNFGALFNEAKWLVKAATYTMANFDRQHAMLPKQASVELTFVRVQEVNRTRADILKYTT